MTELLSFSAFCVFSFGGGVQSHAVLALQAQGKLPHPYDAFVFANVGADSENPKTLAYIERYTKPFCANHNIRFVEVQKRLRNGDPDTLLNRIMREQKSIVIPARMGANGAPGNRNCTEDHKINVVEAWCKRERKSANGVITGLGISVDEFQRARDTAWTWSAKNTTRRGYWTRREYPLIDLRLSRSNCVSIIESAGLPTPPKSSCWFCPFKRRGEWIDMKRQDADLFAAAVIVESAINFKRNALRKDDLYLHSSTVPLEKAVGNQMGLFDEVWDSCESGYCHT